MPRAAEEVAGEDGYVGGALGKAAHEVGEPVAAVGDVDAQAIALFDQAALQVGAHNVGSPGPVATSRTES